VTGTATPTPTPSASPYSYTDGYSNRNPSSDTDAYSGGNTDANTCWNANPNALAECNTSDPGHQPVDPYASSDR
jgi:hypothetical protein